ncbi:DUF3458 domain-containing protein, partial [Aliarcobacter butzleri]|uniref:DUF3458 domain-containing protein n=1 Tax=Aliarcobacter butzleri TaxID=28197 RepID=UPI0019D5EEC9
GHPVNAVLNVTQAEQTFTFDNVYFQPVPALLCDGSAATCDDFVQAMEDASMSICPISAAGTVSPARRL